MLQRNSLQLIYLCCKFESPSNLFSRIKSLTLHLYWDPQHGGAYYITVTITSRMAYSQKFVVANPCHPGEKRCQKHLEITFIIPWNCAAQPFTPPCRLNQPVRHRKRQLGFDNVWISSHQIRHGPFLIPQKREEIELEVKSAAHDLRTTFTPLPPLVVPFLFIRSSDSIVVEKKNNKKIPGASLQPLTPRGKGLSNPSERARWDG